MSETTRGSRDENGSRRTGHETVWDLLPWYVNDTLEGDEQRTVEDHLSACAICREEVRYWHGFTELVHEDGELAVSSGEGLARLRRRMTAAGRTTPVTPDRPAGRRRRGIATLRETPTPVRWALAAQLAAILLLAGLLAATIPPPEAPGQDAAGPDPAATFRTLSDPTPIAPAEVIRLRVVFSDQAREREMRGALITVGGRIVEGPSPTGVYTVAVEPSDEPEEVLETLRSFPQVLLAERAVVGGSPP